MQSFSATGSCRDPELRYISFLQEEKVMQHAQYQWLQSRGWTPELPPAEAGAQRLIFTFGAKQLLKDRALTGELRDHFPGAMLIGGSTSGEIAGDEVTDDSLVATVIGFDHTNLRAAHATIGEGQTSFEVGKELARQLNDETLRHVFVMSDGLKVKGSELAKGIASGVASTVSVTGGLSGDGANFAETVVVDETGAGPQCVAAIGFYGDHLKIGYGSVGGWESFGPIREITRAEGNVLYETDGTRLISTTHIWGRMPRSCQHPLFCSPSRSPRPTPRRAW